MLRRAALAVLSAALVVVGLLAGATPASAASLSINCENDSQSTSVDVGETLTISAAHCTIQSVGGVGSFTPASGYIASSVTFVSATAGTATLTVYGAGVSPTVLTIEVGVSAAAPTAVMSFDANGGDCSTGNPTTKEGAVGAVYTLPTASECSRDNHVLEGWSHDAGAARAQANLAPGATVNFADSGTMYAVWAAAPRYSTIVYDSNVGGFDQCWDAQGENVSPVDFTESGSTPQIVFPRQESVTASLLQLPASHAVCKPPAMVLSSWNTEPDGSGSSYALDQPLGVEFPSSAHLYAQWGLPIVKLRYASSMYLAPPGIGSAGWDDRETSLDETGGVLPVNGNPARPNVGSSSKLTVVALDTLGNPAPYTLVPIFANGNVELWNPADGQFNKTQLVWATTKPEGVTTTLGITEGVFVDAPNNAIGTVEGTLWTWTGGSSPTAPWVFYSVVNTESESRLFRGR